MRQIKNPLHVTIGSTDKMWQHSGLMAQVFAFQMGNKFPSINPASKIFYIFRSSLESLKMKN
jgi:hypothetical protein